MERPTVCWTEIPVSDLDKAQTFYESVFGWTMTHHDGPPNPWRDFASMDGVHGHIYPGTPAAEGQGPTLHLVVPDRLEEAAKRCRDGGGRVLGEVIEIPPGRFQYAQDPDGNSLGLFEPTQG